MERVLKWDGSNIGSAYVLTQWKIRASKYCILRIPNLLDTDIICNYEITKQGFQCLSDELKEVFHILKRGSHQVTLRSIKGSYDVRLGSYVIFPVQFDATNAPIAHTSLSLIETADVRRLNADLVEQIRSLLVYRDLLGMKSTNLSNICIERRGENYIAISVGELSTNAATASLFDFSVLSIRLLNEWLTEETIEQVIRRMLRIDPLIKLTDISGIITSLLDRIEEIVRRVNPEFVWLIGFIGQRVSNALI
jgi:hypothetical protein